MKKKVLISVIVIFVLLILGGIVLYFNDSFRFKLSYEYINYVEYSNGKKIEISVPLDNRIKYISEDELLNFLEDGTGVLYFGYNTCPWCRNVVPVLIDTVKKNDIDTIYYADPHKLDMDSIRSKLYDILDSYLRENEEGKKVLAVPDVYFIKDGEIIGHHIGTLDSYKNPYKGMSKKQKQELSENYQKFIKEMKS